ncbi:hypothetical protein ACELLULO517_07680 [Acidisoma cellulosilytica]|uniref:Uncharacterized protein n=1 Tax=Acidisoma cellulosilyticum TaxID=2802395 RepID=A0A964E359_9PROT|nr:hypothetical protein [Acidisoma cellulosilyticum]MCB8880111.1 hypothetical protein [Acidisoma cellulosilyticum]
MTDTAIRGVRDGANLVLSTIITTPHPAEIESGAMSQLERGSVRSEDAYLTSLDASPPDQIGADHSVTDGRGRRYIETQLVYASPEEIEPASSGSKGSGHGSFGGLNTDARSQADDIERDDAAFDGALPMGLASQSVDECPTPIGPAESLGRRKRAKSRSVADEIVPASGLSDGAATDASAVDVLPRGGEGHSIPDDQSRPALPASHAVADGGLLASISLPQQPVSEANGALSPVIMMPQGSGESPADNARAISSLPTNSSVPELRPSSSAVAAIVGELVELQKQRRLCIKTQSRLDRSIEAFMARFLGYAPDMEAEASKALWKRVRAARVAIEKGGRPVRDSHHTAAPSAGGDGHRGLGDPGSFALAACVPMVLLSAQSRESWDVHRKNVEKRMRTLAKALPAYPWAQQVKGFGDLGLSIILGETGDLSLYATKERVWKRLGLAVIEGQRQGRRTNAEEAAIHGYSPSRRAELWTICTDSMFRHQWAAEKDDRAAGPKGPYGEVYARRRVNTREREGWSLGHQHADACRVMTKALVEDLWRVWNGKEPLQ